MSGDIDKEVQKQGHAGAWEECWGRRSAGEEGAELLPRAWGPAGGQGAGVSRQWRVKLHRVRDDERKDLCSEFHVAVGIASSGDV